MAKYLTELPSNSVLTRRDLYNGDLFHIDSTSASITLVEKVQELMNFEFGTEPFLKLVRQLCYSWTELATKYSSKTVVYTTCYSQPEDLEFFEC